MRAVGYPDPLVVYAERIVRPVECSDIFFPRDRPSRSERSSPILVAFG
jgi:hypothetical protein